MTRLVDAFFLLLKIIIALLLSAMVILVFGNVVLRYAFNSGITVSEEISRWMFVWLTFLGALVALREHGHIGVDALIRRLPMLGRKACLVVSQSLMLFVTWLLLDGAWKQMLINWDVLAPASGLSVAWFYGVGVVFGVVSGAIILADMFRLLTGRLTPDDMVMVRESEEEDYIVPAGAPGDADAPGQGDEAKKDGRV